MDSRSLRVPIFVALLFVLGTTAIAKAKAKDEKRKNNETIKEGKRQNIGNVSHPWIQLSANYDSKSRFYESIAR